MELVKLSSVTKSFGAVRAVDALDLSLGQGEILGFLGTNGAGNMKVAAGLYTIRLVSENQVETTKITKLR